MPSTLVVLMGQKRSGKDTVADRLVTAHGYTRLAFADPLKAAALAINPAIGAHKLADMVRSYGWERAKTHPEARRFLQNLGVAMRAVDPFIWVRPLASAAAMIPGPVVVTDCRFANEYGWAVDCSSSLVRIRRPDLVADSADLHVSEQMAADVEGFPAHWTIANTGTIADLHAAADTLANHLVPTLAQSA